MLNQQSDCAFSDNLTSLITTAMLDAYCYANYTSIMKKDGVAMGSPLGPTMANVFL